MNRHPFTAGASSEKPRVLVAMSGGVDSSVAAALLLEAGYDAIGVHLQLWDHGAANAEREGGRCCSLVDANDASRVCDRLGIPYYVIDASQEFRTHVVGNFIDEYAKSRTPNPCAECNSHIKFDFLFRKADELGCELVATGHYARVLHDLEGGPARLLKAQEPAKDQSYFLYGLTQEALKRTLFPLGGMSKDETRAHAVRLGFANAAKPDSMEICFIGKEGYASFIERHAPDRLLPQGQIVTLDGQVVGEHPGLHHYTIGQRKGLRITAKDPGQYFVVGFDRAKNQLVIGPESKLYRADLQADAMNWIQDLPESVEGVEEECSARIRSRHDEAPARVRRLPGGKAIVRFLDPQRAITPGQAAVFYRGNEVIGGGIIAEEGLPQ